MNKYPLVITREVLLERAGFKPVEHVRRAIKRTVEALDAQRADGSPDHRIHLDAADRVFDLAGVTTRDADRHPDAFRPIAVTLVLATPDPRAALPAGGVTLHLAGDDGDGGAR